jgi:hypothetical protein
VENLADTAVSGSVRPPHGLIRQLIGIAVVLVVLVAGFRLVQHAIDNHVPFAPSAMHLHLTATVHTGDAQHLLRTLGVTEAQLSAPYPRTKHDQFLVGQLTYTLPAGATKGELPLFVIDNRTGRAAMHVWGTSPGRCVTSGWGGFDGFARRYAWLGPTATVQLPGQGYIDPGDTITIPEGRAAPITFIAMFPPETPPVTDFRKDLTVALGFVGDKGQVFWAQRVPIRGTPPVVSPLPPLPTQAQLDATTC